MLSSAVHYRIWQHDVLIGCITLQLDSAISTVERGAKSAIVGRVSVPQSLTAAKMVKATEAWQRGQSSERFARYVAEMNDRRFNAPRMQPSGV